jgi:hypothetical protein
MRHVVEDLSAGYFENIGATESVDRSLTPDWRCLWHFPLDRNLSRSTTSGTNGVFYCLSVGTYMDANGDGIGDFKRPCTASRLSARTWRDRDLADATPARKSKAPPVGIVDLPGGA